ncbi:hypothetical protein H5410_031358 [Solanum commersonii]|uniref:Uncharacterized protein n=1 Tax=Solanum commersonii TaxID=4109 RepID=A0A9J5YLG6_SOLCO|nr:hypothetical protein H5410_031358 [Solanum commersonii]
MLSYGSKYVLINCVLRRIPIHVLSVMIPPKCVFGKLHRIFAKWFWVGPCLIHCIFTKLNQTCHPLTDIDIFLDERRLGV